MIETLSTTLIVIFCVLIFLAQAAGITSFAMLILMMRRNGVLAGEVASLKADVALAKAEIVDGQFKLAELETQGLKAATEYLNKVGKEVVDSNFDAINKNTEDVLKLNTENSQKVYDALVILIQMMNGLMSAMGYRPSAPVPDSGLEDPKGGASYNKPPAQDVRQQEGLTFTRY
jgi:hypothetical protein